MARAVPAPDSGTVCGLFEALSVIVMFPASAPSAFGANVTEMMQVFPAASVLPQGFVLVFRAKSPLGAMLPMFSVPLPVFLSVTFFAALVTPSMTLPNFRDAGVRVTAGPLAFPVIALISALPFGLPQPVDKS